MQVTTWTILKVNFKKAEELSFFLTINMQIEIKVGSFTWENAYSTIQSPTASPLASSTQSNASTPVTVSEEYKLFIKSIRNLVHV